MRVRLAHIVLVTLALAGLAGCRKASVIPANRMSDIYCDMFMMDQWVKDNLEARRTADTTLVYEPIFNKYGYTLADYNKSVDYYLENPDLFVKIAENTVEKLKAGEARMNKLSEEIRKVELANSRFEGYEDKDFCTDSVKWKFGPMKEMIDSILTERKWIISQENTDTLRTN